MAKKKIAKRPAAKKKSTALVRRPTATLTVVPPIPVVPVANSSEALQRLSDEPIALSMGMIKFTDAEELVLSEDVPRDEILIKPTGQIYLSHPTYVRLFNRAFGRGQWHLLQLQKPQKAGTTIIVLYAFVVHGVPLYSAYGAAEYHETNREQTYDDVLEATNAYAIRRFAKRLGVGLELWDKRFIAAYMDANAVCVKVTNRDGSFKKAWRHKNDRALPFEAGVARIGDDTPEAQRQQTRRQPQAQARAEAPAASNPKAEEPVTEKQVLRFWTIARHAGRTDDEVKAFLLQHYHLDSSKKIARKDYEAICMAAEHPGPMLPARVPGQEG